MDGFMSVRCAIGTLTEGGAVNVDVSRIIHSRLNMTVRLGGDSMDECFKHFNYLKKRIEDLEERCEKLDVISQENESLKKRIGMLHQELQYRDNRIEELESQLLIKDDIIRKQAILQVEGGE